MQQPVRRRSCLTVPGGSDKMLVKAHGLDADEIVFDLEDAVAPDDKTAAREKVAALLATPAWVQRTVAVRINGIGTVWWRDDIAALAGLAHPQLTLVVPKVESASDFDTLEQHLGAREAESGRGPKIGLQGLIETAGGLVRVAEIAGASERLQSLILGYADLASSLGRGVEGDWSFAQNMIVLAARANGLQAIDGPYFAFGESQEPALVARSMAVAGLGFDGKWAIHPSQIGTINAAFTPGEAEVAQARGIVAALDAARAAGNGATTYEGGMIDEAMRAGAERILVRADERVWL
ncbi:MAG: CoA ester lyase [Devosia sp.]